MSRLIDADAFKEHMDYVCDAGGWMQPVTSAVIEYVKKNIDAEKTVDAVPVVHGKWVFNENEDMFYCTNCKNGSVRNDYPYCHWCGAVMYGEKVTE